MTGLPIVALLALATLAFLWAMKLRGQRESAVT